MRVSAFHIVTSLILLCSTKASIANPTFSMPHGLYDKGPITIVITPNTPDAEVRYTIDGSVPTKSSILYTQPLIISSTTILRAVEVEGDSVSKPSTSSYIFLESVLNQKNNPTGYPTRWGKFCFNEGYAPADYEMDPELVSDSDYRSNIIQGLKDIPVLSVVTDKDHLFNETLDEEKGGIYMFTGTYEGTGEGIGKGWTRPASIELFGQASPTFEFPQIHDLTADCGIRLHGGSSRVPDKSPKHSFRLLFKKEYGEGKLDYPLFGENEPTGYNQLILRSHFNLSWYHWGFYERYLAQFTRDVWARRMQRKMGYLSDNALYVNLFLNGMYWGLYNIAERIDDQFCKQHLGGKKADYDVIKVEDDIEDVIEAADGDLEEWDKMVKLIRDCKNDKSYKQLQGNQEQEPLLDIDNFIDYMLINQMGGNIDWGRHNWFAIRKKGSDSKGFQFICWDSEAVFVLLQDDVLSLNNENCPTEFFRCLIHNKKFAEKYVKRASEVLAPNGLLGPASVTEVWDSLHHTIRHAIYAESARWGDYRRDVHPYDKKGDLFTADHYYNERARLNREYFPYRSQLVLKNILSFIDKETGSDYSSDIASPHMNGKRFDLYDLRGNKILKPGKGVYIKNGKKHLK